MSWTEEVQFTLGLGIFLYSAAATCWLSFKFGRWLFRKAYSIYDPQVFCKHEVSLKSLKRTGAFQEPPEFSEFDGDWAQYQAMLDVARTSPEFQKRVSAKCVKCGKTLYAHAGYEFRFSGDM